MQSMRRWQGREPAQQHRPDLLAGALGLSVAATRRARSVCTQRYLVLELRLLTKLYGMDDAPECPPDTSLPPGA